MKRLTSLHSMKLLAIAAIAVPTALDTATAATATTKFNVQITITSECKITSASVLNFGSSGVISVDIDAQSALGVQCTNGTAYTVGLDKGASTGATITNRAMTRATGTDLVNYAIFSDAARTKNWGVTAGTDTVAGTGNGAVQTIPVYGRVKAQTTPQPGNYVDTVTVTVTY